jgi:acyl carrier protein
MSNTDIVIKLVAEHFDISKDTVKVESDVFDDLGADSLDSIELILELEKNFDIEVTDDEIDNIRTVQDIIDLVDNLV